MLGLGCCSCSQVGGEVSLLGLDVPILYLLIPELPIPVFVLRLMFLPDGHTIA